MYASRSRDSRVSSMWQLLLLSLLLCVTNGCGRIVRIPAKLPGTSSASDDSRSDPKVPSLKDPAAPLAADRRWPKASRSWQRLLTPVLGDETSPLAQARRIFLSRDRDAPAGESDWYLADDASVDQHAAESGDYRWQHARLIELFKSYPQQSEQVLRTGVRSKDFHIAEAACIGLARLGDARSLRRLTTLILDRGTNSATRLAACETFGRLSSHSQLDKLLDQVARWQRDYQRRVYMPGVHAELLRAVPPSQRASHPAILKGLSSPSARVKIQAVKLLGESGESALPTQALELLSPDESEEVRVAAIEAIGACREVGGLDDLLKAVDDGKVLIRHAAITALGRLATKRSRDRLLAVIDGSNRQDQAEAIVALAQLGDLGVLKQFSVDKSWVLRNAVARGIEFTVPEDTLSLAEALIQDSQSRNVRQSVITSISRWPTADAGPLLLLAMQFEQSKSLRNAVETQLQRRLQIADDTRQPIAERVNTYAEAWENRYGSLDAYWERGHQWTRPNHASDTFEAHLQPGRNVIALSSAGSSAVLASLKSPDRWMRVKASEVLARRAQQPSQSLTSQEQKQLLAILIRERDGEVWQHALDALPVRRCTPEAEAIAYFGLRHARPDVRRASAQWLAETDGRHGTPLAELLRDPNLDVRMAAVKALGRCGDSSSVRPLSHLLDAEGFRLRLAAATSLHHLRDVRGTDALMRMASSRDYRIRRESARAMGSLRDPQFQEILFQLLEDPKIDVQVAALTAIESTVRDDVATLQSQQLTSTREKIQFWLQWQQNSP